MEVVPLQAVPSQIVAAALGGQNCRIAVHQLATGLYCDLYVGTVQIIAGVLCENINRIVRDLYLGFAGDLIFYDSEGSDDPEYTGLGKRFFLVYMDVADLGGLG